MAQQASLSAQPRSERGKSAARKLRASGRLPAVVYGHGEETQALSVDEHEVELLFSRISVESTLITLKIDGASAEKGGEVRAPGREGQTPPVKGDLGHGALYQIHAGE